ncbi:MAG: GGDEF domain-containing protein [Clostridia bacterium]|nr:GGDEF domain-containing protein [Clostridia bacterium]
MLLCVILSFVSYEFYTHTMYNRYQEQLTAIIDYVDAHVDRDDMAVCARTLEESEKYKEFQAFFDDFIDYYGDIHYLYIMKVDDGPNGHKVVYEVCAANSTYEKENEPDLVMHLGDVETEDDPWYDDAMRTYLLKIQQGSEDVFFTNPSAWGIDYTMARPLISSTGEHFAMLCADISIDNINITIYRNINYSILLIAALGLLFILAFIWWMRRNVTKPLKRLENSVTAFANDSTGKRNPDDLHFSEPEIRDGNEVASLSKAVSKLADDMRDYVKSMVAAEREATEMSTIAYRDALTHVRSKAAYDEVALVLAEDIADGGAEFAIVMADLNGLKIINDLYGHHRGDDYLRRSSHLICDTFARSPVFRVGGDEFIVILRGRDYRERDALVESLRARVAEMAAQPDLEPWERASIAVGMAAYQPGDNLESVFKRADQAMYEDKARIKNAR